MERLLIIKAKSYNMKKIEVNAELVTIFLSFQQWVQNASTFLGPFPKTEKIICIDKKGNACNTGSEFMHARDYDLFPVKAYRLIKSGEKV